MRWYTSIRVAPQRLKLQSFVPEKQSWGRRAFLYPFPLQHRKGVYQHEQDPHRLYLTEDQMPQKWFNLRSAMAEQPDPLLHPGTLRPLGVDDLSPIFCEELARQELDGATAYVDIPEPIQKRL